MFEIFHDLHHSDSVVNKTFSLFKKGSVSPISQRVCSEVVASGVSEKTESKRTRETRHVPKAVTGAMAVLDFHLLLASPSTLKFPFFSTFTELTWMICLIVDPHLYLQGM